MAEKIAAAGADSAGKMLTRVKRLHNLWLPVEKGDFATLVLFQHRY